MAAQLGHRGAAKILISAISSSSLLSHRSAEPQVEALTKQVESLKEQLAHSEEKVESLRKKVAELQKEKEDDWHDEP
ncbi:hypothetical protein Pelo_15646 [Pelomyxa schiedti]|nr:hypothetical protein Pelo_15646 [Pelomyxa schiedti]